MNDRHEPAEDQGQTLQSQLWDLVYGLLEPDDAQALLQRITSDPQAARAYAEVCLQTEQLAAAARLENTPVALRAPSPQPAPQPQATRSTARRRWPVALTCGLAAAVLLMLTLAPSLLPPPELDSLARHYPALTAEGPTLVHAGRVAEFEITAQDGESRASLDEVELSWQLQRKHDATAPQPFKTDDGRATLRLGPEVLKAGGELVLSAGEDAPRLRFPVTVVPGSIAVRERARMLARVPERRAGPDSGGAARFEEAGASDPGGRGFGRASAASAAEPPVDTPAASAPSAKSAAGVQDLVATNPSAEKTDAAAMSAESLRQNVVRQSGDAAEKAQLATRFTNLGRTATRDAAHPPAANQLAFYRRQFQSNQPVVADLYATDDDGQALVGQKVLGEAFDTDGQAVYRVHAATNQQGQLRLRLPPAASQQTMYTTLTVRREDASRKLIAASDIPLADPQLQVRLQTQGAAIAAGLPSRLSFLLTDERQQPIAAAGRLLDSQGQTVATLKADNGFGTAQFVPVPNESYVTEWFAANGAEAVQPLAAPQSSITVDCGTGLFPANEPIRLQIASQQDQQVAVVARSDGAIVARQRVSLSQDASQQVDLALDQAVQGPVELTVYDDTLQHTLASQQVLRQDASQDAEGLASGSYAYLMMDMDRWDLPAVLEELGAAAYDSQDMATNENASDVGAVPAERLARIDNHAAARASLDAAWAAAAQDHASQRSRLRGLAAALSVGLCLAMLLMAVLRVVRWPLWLPLSVGSAAAVIVCLASSLPDNGPAAQLARREPPEEEREAGTPRQSPIRTADSSPQPPVAGQAADGQGQQESLSEADRESDSKSTMQPAADAPASAAMTDEVEEIRVLPIPLLKDNLNKEVKQAFGGMAAPSIGDASGNSEEQRRLLEQQNQALAAGAMLPPLQRAGGAAARPQATQPRFTGGGAPPIESDADVSRGLRRRQRMAAASPSSMPGGLAGGSASGSAGGSAGRAVNKPPSAMDGPIVAAAGRAKAAGMAADAGAGNSDKGLQERGGKAGQGGEFRLAMDSQPPRAAESSRFGVSRDVAAKLPPADAELRLGSSLPDVRLSRELVSFTLAQNAADDSNLVRMQQVLQSPRTASLAATEGYLRFEKRSGLVADQPVPVSWDIPADVERSTLHVELLLLPSLQSAIRQEIVAAEAGPPLGCDQLARSASLGALALADLQQRRLPDSRFLQDTQRTLDQLTDQLSRHRLAEGGYAWLPGGLRDDELTSRVAAVMERLHDDLGRPFPLLSLADTRRWGRPRQGLQDALSNARQHLSESWLSPNFLALPPEQRLQRLAQAVRQRNVVPRTAELLTLTAANGETRTAAFLGGQFEALQLDRLETLLDHQPWSLATSADYPLAFQLRLQYVSQTMPAPQIPLDWSVAGPPRCLAGELIGIQVDMRPQAPLTRVLAAVALPDGFEPNIAGLQGLQNQGQVDAFAIEPGRVYLAWSKLEQHRTVRVPAVASQSGATAASASKAFSATAAKKTAWAAPWKITVDP